MVEEDVNKNAEDEGLNTENELPVEEQADEASSAVNELDAQKDKYMRLLAEFENFKRRTARERIELFRTAGQDVIKDLLPALDDVDRAEQVIKAAQSVEAVKEGLKLISDKLKNILTQKGLKEIECLGAEFNTDMMEAITEIDVADKSKKGRVVDVLEKGYTLNDKIIRYAKVVTGK